MPQISSEKPPPTPEFDQPNSCLTPFLRLSLAQRGNIAKRLVQNGEKTNEIESYDKQPHIRNIKCHLTKYGAFFGTKCSPYLKVRVKGVKGLKCNYLANACCSLRLTTGGNPTLANLA